MKVKKEFEIELPEDLQPDKSYLYKGKQNYTVEDLSIMELSNVFVSHEGLCLKNLRLVKHSHFNLKGNLDQTFNKPFRKLAVEQYLVSTYGSSLKKERLNEGQFLHIYTKWFGYFFWITDCLPKLIATQDRHADLKLLFPENWKDVGYVQDTLELFPNLEREIIKNGVHMQVKHLILPQTRSWSNAISPYQIEETRSFVFKELMSRNISTNLGSRIYISRSKALRRKPINEEAVEEKLAEYGFACISMEDYSFLDQISIMKHARYVVGIHGAGMCNTQFIQPNGAVLELSPEINDAELLRIPFWRIARHVGAKYRIQFCPTPSPQSDLYDSDLLVDIEDLEANLDRMTRN